ncbi:MAG: FxsA family protein, partial [Burkholderiales bacterium]|nr:FxsA family protein [Burkholderiales bacterium]
MPYIVLVWLLLPWLLDLWLTVVIAGAVGVNVWLFFLVSAVLGIALLVWEWRRVQTYWRALRRLEGSPWPLLASARRGLAAVLLIVPGLGSDVLALLLLCLGWRRGS